MLQALWGRSSSNRAAAAQPTTAAPAAAIGQETPRKPEGEAEDLAAEEDNRRTSTEMDLDASDGIDGEEKSAQGQGSVAAGGGTQSNPVKRKREAATKSNHPLKGERIQVTNGVLMKNGVIAQEGQEEEEEEEEDVPNVGGRGGYSTARALPYAETPFGMLPPEMVLHVFSYFLEDLPFLARSIGLTCRHWHDLASSNPLWKRVLMMDFSGALSWTSTDPASTSSETENGCYKDIFLKYHVRIRNNWENGSYSIKALTGHRDFIRCVRFDKNHRAVSSGVDRTVCVWDLKTGACLQTMKGHTGEVDSVDFHDDTIISGSFDSTVRFWDAKTGECTNVLKEAGSILMWCVHLFPESNRVLCPGSTASLALWDSEKREVIHRYTNPTSANVMSMYACGQSGPTDPLLTGSSDKIIRLWDTETGLCKLEMSGHTDSIWAVHYDQGAVITASSDRTVKMWDIRSGECVETLRGHSGTVFCMWADSGYVVSGDSNDWLFVWELRQRRRLQSFKEHEGGLRAVQNDSYKIVSASWDKTIKVWSFV